VGRVASHFNFRVGHSALLLLSAALCMASVCHAQRERDGALPGVTAMSLSCDGSVDPVGVDTAAPEFHWTLGEQSRRDRDVRQSAYQIVVAASRAALDRVDGDVWDSGKVSAPFGASVPYAGKDLASDTLYYWKVRVWDGEGRVSEWSETATFVTGILHPSEWTANWIAATPDGPTQPQAQGDDETRLDAVPPLPIFRHEFIVRRPIVRASLFLSGLGEAETLLNGGAVTSAALTPGWSNYRKTVFYDAYDVTRQLHVGRNVIGVMLGNGMYNVEGLKGRYTKFVGPMLHPKLIAEIRLHYADGSSETIASGEGWRTADGPVTFSSIYGGEDWDARLMPAGWMGSGFNDSAWKPVVVVAGPGGELRSERLPPVQVAHTYRPVKVTHFNDNVTIYDFGENFAGRPEIKVHGPAGSKVRILPGELLDASGRVTQRSAGASPDAPALFDYTLRGGAEEHWSPMFSYYGFRYAEVTLTGDTGLPVVDSIAGQALHDAVAVNGNFSNSDELLNRIHRLIDAAMLNNMMSVLTDCPTREKLGWLEQTHLAGPSLMYNFNLSLLYRKMALDMRDSQLADGMVPSIAPEVVAFSGSFRDSPEWGSAIILSPWTEYTFYGDRRTLRDGYRSMVAYADYLQSKAKNNLISYGLGDWYDIGPGEPGESKLTGKGLTATAIYYQDLTVLARIAVLLDKPDDAAEFLGRAAAVKASFNAYLFHPESMSYDRGSQTANAMALALGLVPEEYRKGVLDNIVRDIHSHGDHVTAGDIGYHYLIRALTDGGRSDVLYAMLKRTDSPSYGYQLKQGATALTEAWDANPASSQDHFMLGHAEEWFYRGLGGIDFDMSRERDKRIWVHPQIVDGVSSSAVEYQSVLGKIVSSWRLHGDELRMDVSVPPGATATISLPAGFHREVLESGRALQGDPGVASVDDRGDSITCVVGSGEYHLSARR
jgi:alpha-L-rhamnosidase